MLLLNGRIADQLSDQENTLIILGNKNESTGNWVIKSNNEALADASDILKKLLSYSGGKGGGKARFSQGVQANSGLMNKAISDVLKSLNLQKT